MASVFQSNTEPQNILPFPLTEEMAFRLYKIHAAKEFQYRAGTMLPSIYELLRNFSSISFSDPDEKQVFDDLLFTINDTIETYKKILKDIAIQESNMQLPPTVE